MSQSRDWQGTLREAVEQIKTRYDFIGRQTGASFLGVVYPPEVESAVLREWKTLTSGLGSEFEVRTVDVLAVTMLVVDELGSEAIGQTGVAMNADGAARVNCHNPVGGTKLLLFRYLKYTTRG